MCLHLSGRSPYVSAVTAFLAVTCPLLSICQPFAAGSTVSTSADWGCRPAALSRLYFLASLNSAMLECTLPSLSRVREPHKCVPLVLLPPVEVPGPLAEACPAQLCCLLAVLSCREWYCQFLCFQERARTAGRGLYAASNPFVSGWQGRGATWCTFLRPPGSRVWLGGAGCWRKGSSESGVLSPLLKRKKSCTFSLCL